MTRNFGALGIAAVGFLVTVAVAHPIAVNWGRIFPKGHAARVKTDLVAITHAVEKFASEHEGKLPSSIQQILDDARREQPVRFHCCNDAPLDPWDREYIYCPHPDGSFEVGALGGDGDAAGIFLQTRTKPSAEVTRR